MYTHPTKAERNAIAFKLLDVNGTGTIETSALVGALIPQTQPNLMFLKAPIRIYIHMYIHTHQEASVQCRANPWIQKPSCTFSVQI